MTTEQNKLADRIIEERVGWRDDGGRLGVFFNGSDMDMIVAALRAAGEPVACPASAWENELAGRVLMLEEMLRKANEALAAQPAPSASVREAWSAEAGPVPIGDRSALQKWIYAALLMIQEDLPHEEDRCVVGYAAHELAALSSTPSPLMAAGEAAEPKNLPDNWDYMKDTNSVRCGGCLFRFGAEHPDSDGKWTCPNCGNGNGEKAAAPQAFAESAEQNKSHIMCIGWPTIRRLMQGEAVWFDDLGCGAIAASDLLQTPADSADVRWAVNVLLEMVAKKFENWETFDLFRSDAATAVRGFKHDLSARVEPQPSRLDASARASETVEATSPAKRDYAARVVTDGSFQEGDEIAYEVNEATGIGRVTSHTRTAAEPTREEIVEEISRYFGKYPHLCEKLADSVLDLFIKPRGEPAREGGK